MSAPSFAFASLLFAAAQPAMAGEPAPVAQQAQGDAAPVSESLSAQWATSVKDGVLTARLTLVNAGASPVDFLLLSGKSPGTRVNAMIDGTTLSRVLDESQEREMMSRRGPMPTYAAVAAKGSIEAGTWRFALPAGYRGEPIRLESTVRTADGQRIQLPVIEVRAGDGQV